MKKLLLLGLLALAPLAALADNEPLPPDQAYKMTVTAAGGTITAKWDILPGYYLYKDKFKFLSHTPAVTLGKPALPAGEMKQDKFFGREEIYKQAVTATLPYTGSGALDLEIVYQGCNEPIGFCYPPQHKRLNLTLAAAAPAATPAAVHAPDLQSLIAGGAPAGQDYLPVDQAFRFSAVAKDSHTLEVRWQVAPGYYLYRQKFDLKSDDPEVQLGMPDFPEGKIKNDPYFGTSEIYPEDVDVLVPVSYGGAPGKFNLTAAYQGCAEKGFCYPPQTRVVSFDLATAGAAAPAVAAPAPMAEQDRLALLIKDGNLILVFLAFIGYGLLLTFTPCVLPMVPIISGIIVGQGKISTPRAFLLSLTYVLAMALVYAIAGVVVGLAGANIQLALQNPWVLSVFSLIFVLLALSMFGFYELQVPSFIQTHLTHHSNKQSSGAFLGVGIMGALSALICGPCITAPLVAALIFIGETGSALRGGVALFALGLGMGVPLLIIGTSAGKLVPKAGHWMNAVKAVFGVVMLALAIWFLSRVLPGPVSLALWAALAIVCGVYLSALDPLQAGASGWRKLWKGLGLIALVYGILLLVAAALGGSDPLRPFDNYGRGGTAALGAGSVANPTSSLPFKHIKTSADLDRELAAAKGSPVMLDFYADWCISCKELEHDTYSDPAVQGALANVTLLQADVTANDAD
ncbi:MAG TPA: protein-disulfide reductase DsbD, partial [Gammaproteobacteria bacterium]|nr:protein-disulfide reductase DsbD [Gammaproteobacteria bacterium]